MRTTHAKINPVIIFVFVLVTKIAPDNRCRPNMIDIRQGQGVTQPLELIILLLTLLYIILYGE